MVTKRTVDRRLRRLEKKFYDIAAAIRGLDAGDFDDRFVDDATKAQLRACLEPERVDVLTASYEELAAIGEVARISDPATGEIHYCGTEAARRLKPLS